MQPSKNITTTQVYSLHRVKAKGVALAYISFHNPVKTLILFLSISSAAFPYCSAPYCYLQHGPTRAQTNISCPCLQLQLYSSTEEKEMSTNAHQENSTNLLDVLSFVGYLSQTSLHI